MCQAAIFDLASCCETLKKERAQALKFLKSFCCTGAQAHQSFTERPTLVAVTLSEHRGLTESHLWAKYIN